METVSVAIVGICSARHLRRCLEALRAQQDAPPFEIVVAYDPALEGIAAVREEYPDVRIVCNENQRTPLSLASRAISESRGEIVLLTEDHCIPDRRWVGCLVASLQPGWAAAGGVIELAAEGATAIDWAFYFVDFFRYADPVEDGASPSLSVCNVAYRRRDLDAIADLWTGLFHETAVNELLQRRFGPLRLVPRCRVAMRRHVRLSDALYERYAFGRLFGVTRLRYASPGMRRIYRTFAPLLPKLLLFRMARKAFRSRELRRWLARGWLPLTLMTIWWSWGEWLGYLTARLPARLTVAPERDLHET